MKTVRVDFTKGINHVTDKRMMPEGYSLVADNVDLRSGAMRAFRYPVWFAEAPTGTTRIWEYRGKWYFSALWRDYAAEFVGQQERIYFTEMGHDHALPQKIISGIQAPLGTPPPLKPVTVEAGDSAVVSGVAITFWERNSILHFGGNDPRNSIGTLTAGTYSYRVAAELESGVQGPSVAVSGGISGDHVGGFELTWASVPGAVKYHIYGRTAGAEKEIDTTAATVYFDTGTKAATGTPAVGNEAQAEYQYIYTFVRDVNGHQDESGPSPVSALIRNQVSRLITRDALADGGFQVDADLTFLNPTTAISVAATVAGTTKSVVGVKAYTGTNKSLFNTSTAHGMTNDSWVYVVALEPSDINRTFDVKVPTALVSPNVLTNTVQDNDGSATGLANATYVYKATAFRGDTVNSTLEFGVPAQTTPGVSLSVVVSTPSKFQYLVCADVADADGYIWYRDDVPFAISSDTNVTDNGESQLPAGSTPVLPGANETATHAFIVEGLQVSNTTAQGGALTAVINPTSVVTLGAPHGITITEVHAASFEDFTEPNFSGIHNATITSTTAFTVPIYTANAQNSTTAPYSIKFSEVVPGTTTDVSSFYAYWNLYRTGDTPGFLLVAQIPFSQTEYTDQVGTADLGEPPDSYYTENGKIVVFDAPPDDLHGIEYHYSMLAGISGNSVRWTPIDRPDAWPQVMAQSFDHPPLALASVESYLLVLCKDALYVLNGFEPTAVTLTKTQVEDGCIAPRSVQKTSSGLIYLSKRGIMRFRNLAAECLTETRISGNFFTAGSSLDTAPGFWWYPTEVTYNYGALTSDPDGYGQAGASLNNLALNQANNQTILGPIYNIRSFVYDNKYFMFWSDFI